MTRTKRKRYVLLMADGDLGKEGLSALSRYLEQRHGKLKLIQPDANGASLIVKTDLDGAAAILDSCADVRVAGRRVTTALVSGCVGKLKRRASETASRGIGQVSE